MFCGRLLNETTTDSSESPPNSLSKGSFIQIIKKTISTNLECKMMRLNISLVINQN